MEEADITTRLNWSKEDALVTCQSLRQLGLAHEPDPDIVVILLEDTPEKRS